VLWVGRVDALIAWRNAPPDRPLVETGLTAAPVLNASGMDSPAAAGPRFSIFRFNDAAGTALETTYFQLANWRSERPLSAQSNLYALAPPGFYGNGNTQNFDTGDVNLGAWMKSLEINRHWWIGQHARFLAGFRWVEWQENFSMSDEFVGTETIQDFYSTECFNSLYGGQIGADLALWNSGGTLQVNGVGKAGVFYNHAFQRTWTNLPDSGLDGVFGERDLTSFFGEVGINASYRITQKWAWRVGYSLFWLSGVAVPANQLGVADVGTVRSINGNGSVLLHGVTTGLEARW
jgi:hypothetical protein